MTFEITSSQKKSHPQRNGCNFNGALTGTRTQDPVIKSHLLYQLSYERLMLHNIDPVFENFKLKIEKSLKKYKFYHRFHSIGPFFTKSEILGEYLWKQDVIFPESSVFGTLHIFSYIPVPREQEQGIHRKISWLDHNL